MSNCPSRSEADEATAICYKCGSFEHKINECRVKRAKGM